MHTVELLEEALRVAQEAGYSVRQEWLGGEGGGGCEIKGKKWLFLDLAQSPREQLEQVTDALRGEPTFPSAQMHMELRRLLEGKHPSR